MNHASDRPDHAQVLALPPLVYGAAILGGFGLQRLWPLPMPQSVTTEIAGWALMIAGLSLLLWAMAGFVRRKTAIMANMPTTALVCDGPYRLSRNPIYFAMNIVQAAFALMFANLWILLLLPPVVVFVRYGVIAREEAYLERKFGVAYRDYRSRVRRWL